MAADVNRDGKPDLVVMNHCGSDQSFCSTTDGAIGVLLGNGDGSFKEALSYDSGGVEPAAMTVADVNGDGKPDVLVANCGCQYNSSANSTVLLGNGNGTFQTAKVFETFSLGATGLWSLAVADLNGDGKPDVVGATSSDIDGAGEMQVLLGNGDGTFQAPQVYRSGGFLSHKVALADVNLDGKLDAILIDVWECPTCVPGSVRVLLGNGNGNFQPLIQHYNSGGSESESAVLGDVNGDGRLDLVVASASTVCGPRCSTGPGAVGVLLGAAKFSTTTSFVSSLNPSIYGQPVTFVANVTHSGSFQPTGTVNFKWGNGYTIGSAALKTDGTATLTKSNLNADSYPLTAVYSGDANNLTSISPVVNQVVYQTKSAAALTSLPNPSTVGQAVTFTAKITSLTVIPKGPVTFTEGKTILGTVQLSGGKATLTVSSLPKGSTLVKVTFNGDSNITTSSASVTQVVQP